MRRGLLPAARPLLPDGRPVTAKMALCIARSRWPGAGRSGRRMAATTASRPVRATVPHPLRAATWPLSVATGRPSGTEVQVHPAALPLDFIKLAFAVVLTAGLEREQLHVSQ